MPSLARSTVYNAVGSAAMLGSGFLTTIIAARMLGPQAVGLVAFATLIVSLALAVIDLGLPGAMTRYVPELKTRGEGKADAVAAAILIPYAAFTVACSIGLYIALRLSDINVGSEKTLVCGLVAAAVAVQGLAAFHYGVLKGQQDFVTFAVLAVLSGTLQVAIAVVGALAYGVPGVLAAPVIAFALPAAAALWRMRKAQSLGGLTLMRRLLMFSSQTWLIYIFTTVSWSRVEIYFLRARWGDHDAGLFAAGLNLANLALQGPMFLTGALLPYLVAKHTEDPNALAPAFRQTLTYFAMVVFPLTLGIAAIAPLLLPLIYGPGFREAIPAATILIAGNAAMAVIAIVQQFAFATERVRALLLWSATTAALTLVSGLTLTQTYGVLGAAWGRAGLLAGSAVFMLILARRWGWPIPYAALSLIAGLSALAALGLHLAVRG